VGMRTLGREEGLNNEFEVLRDELRVLFELEERSVSCEMRTWK
jgi:hypothetical protein